MLLICAVLSVTSKCGFVCAPRLSKELQHKDKIIESLHTKLNQRPETPSSCQALSETTDPSDRTSPVSDECRTNEDLELCSDLDSREYQQEHRQQPGCGSERDGIVTVDFCSPLPCGTFFPFFHFHFLQSVHLSLQSVRLSSNPPAVVPTCFVQPLWV